MPTLWPTNALFAQDWTLDGLGNFGEFKEDADGQPGWETDQDRTVNAANEIQTITGGNWIAPQYDAAGNMISGPAPGDESTRLHFTYDAWNRLVKVHADDAQTPGEQGDLLAAYERDGLNRRVEKTVTAAGDGPRWVDYYYNANWQLLEEREFDESLEPAESRVYVWSPRYIDAPILRDRYDDEGQLDDDARLYYLGDANFNVTALLQENPQTPGTWQVAERYVYTPYGEATVCDASWSTNPQSPIPNPIRYAGYFLDSETGVYDVRHRPYHSTISTFLARDPLGYAAGDVNLYRYVGADPANATDPLGLDRWLARPPDVWFVHGFLLVEVPANMDWKSLGRNDLAKAQYVELHFNIAGPRVDRGYPPTTYYVQEHIPSPESDDMALICAWFGNGGGLNEPPLYPFLYAPLFWDCNAVSHTYKNYPTLGAPWQ